MAAQGLGGGGKGKVLFTGSKFQFCIMKRGLVTDGGNSCTTRSMYLILLNCMF